MSCSAEVFLWFCRLVPLPVISGFMSGVGCIILATQSLAVLGYEPVGSALVRCLAVQSTPLPWTSSHRTWPQWCTWAVPRYPVSLSLIYLLRHLLLLCLDQQAVHGAATAASRNLLLCCSA